jgi:hypothetical protein
MWHPPAHSYSLHDGVLSRVYHQQPSTRLSRWCCPSCLDTLFNMAQLCNTSTSYTRTAADVCSASHTWQHAAVAVPRVRGRRAACCRRMPLTPAALSSRSSSPRDAVETLDLPPPPPPLKPVPIIHTTAYLQQTQQLVVSHDTGLPIQLWAYQLFTTCSTQSPSCSMRLGEQLRPYCQVAPPATPPQLYQCMPAASLCCCAVATTPQPAAGLSTAAAA